METHSKTGAIDDDGQLHGFTQEDDNDFVSSVMSSQTNIKCVEESSVTQDRKRTRLELQEDIGTTCVNESQKTHVMSAIDTLTNKMTECFIGLSLRLDDMEKNFEEKLLQKVNATIDRKVFKMKQTIDKDITVVKNNMAKMEKECAEAIKTMKNSYADVLKSQSGTRDSTRDNNIVIRNLGESADERNDPRVVKHKVDRLVRDGLKLVNVNIVEAKRKPGRGDRPGLVIATVETREQKSQLMKSKVALRESRDYRSVYLESDLTVNELQTQSSLRTILREMGRERDYVVTGNRIVQRSEERRDRAPYNGTYSGYRNDSHPRPSRGSDTRLDTRLDTRPDTRSDSRYSDKRNSNRSGDRSSGANGYRRK